MIVIQVTVTFFVQVTSKLGQKKKVSILQLENCRLIFYVVYETIYKRFVDRKLL